MPEEVEKLIWEMQAQALAPLAAAGKLGCMLFQFPPWFTARRDHIDYLKRLRERSEWPMAAEFRGGGWMTNYRARTLSLLESKMSFDRNHAKTPRCTPSFDENA